MACVCGVVGAGGGPWPQWLVCAMADAGGVQCAVLAAGIYPEHTLQSGRYRVVYPEHTRSIPGAYPEHTQSIVLVYVETISTLYMLRFKV